MKTFILTCVALLSLAGTSKMHAQVLNKSIDEQGAVHFGTEANPNQCCYCKRIIGQQSHDRWSVYSTLNRRQIPVAPENHFQSPDGVSWVCPAIGTNDSEVAIPSCALLAATS